MGLSAGRLRDRVVIMRKAALTQTEDGDLEGGWAPVATVWAEVLGVNGREAVIAQALQGVSAYRITIRYRADLSDADQIVHTPFGATKPLTLNIRSISDPEGRREQLLILADTASAQATA